MLLMKVNAILCYKMHCLPCSPNSFNSFPSYIELFPLAGCGVGFDAGMCYLLSLSSYHKIASHLFQCHLLKCLPFLAFLKATLSNPEFLMHLFLAFPSVLVVCLYIPVSVITAFASLLFLSLLFLLYKQQTIFSLHMVERVQKYPEET